MAQLPRPSSTLPSGFTTTRFALEVEWVTDYAPVKGMGRAGGPARPPSLARRAIVIFFSLTPKQAHAPHQARRVELYLAEDVDPL
jgi:hypothetical protein